MAAAKCTLCFESKGYGWTENYWQEAASADLTAELAKANVLASKRILMCGRETTIPYIKISQEGKRGDILLGNYLSDPYVGVSTEDSDVPSTAILMKKKTTNNVESGITYLRGNMDSALTKGGIINQTFDPFMNAFSGFRQKLLSDNWGFLTKDVAASQTSAVANVSPDVNGRLEITLTNAVLGALVGKKVKVFISGVTGSVGANGSHIVVVTDDNKMKTTKRVPTFAYTGNGKLSYSPQKWIKISYATMERSVQRKPGGVFYHSRGRAKAKKQG